MAEPNSIQLQPIGWVRGGRTEPIDDAWAPVKAEIVLDHAQLAEEATKGLQEFSHLCVVYFFHQVPEDKIQTGARHPRNNPDWPKVGILAQRGKMRPNRLGVSSCRLLAVDGLVLTVQGLDAIDGTPIIDIKPYMREFDPAGEVTQPTWASELMQGYW
jgi:tRNA (adenine37-N6)-methyltransferase